MRDLLFKNLTSADKRGRVITSRELSEQDGLRTHIYRHLFYRITKVKETDSILPKPILYVLKKRDAKAKVEMFYCRIKGNIYMTVADKIYLINYVHSLRILLRAVPKVAVH